MVRRLSPEAMSLLLTCRVSPGRAAVRRLGLAAPLLLLMAACTGGGVTSTTGPTLVQPSLVPYDSGSPYHLAFKYPASWAAREYDEVSSFSTLVVYLSNQPMVAPCKTTKSAKSTSVNCGLAVEHLGRGGVLAWWSLDSGPGWSFGKDAPGEPINVGGHRARLSMSMTPQCGRIGADAAIQVVVEPPQVPDNWFQLDACIRGPGVSTAEAQVRALLASTRFGSGTT
jgi:hypothetical protein